MASYFTWKAHEPLNQNKEIQKSAMGLVVTVNLCTLNGLFILQFKSYEIAFSWCLWQTSFPIYFPFFTKICLIISPSNKYPPCWSFKPNKSNQFKVVIKSRTRLTWNADMSLIFQKQHVPHSVLYRCGIKLPQLIVES